MRIRLEDVSTGYGHHVVAQGLNAVLEQGELVSLLGTNGAGKSTLLRTIGGFQPMLGGRILMGDTSLSDLTQAEMSRIVSVVLTERIEIQGLSVRDLVAMGRSPYTGFWGNLKSEDESIVNDAIRQTGIKYLANRMVCSLSDGERQKAVLAKALAQQTPVILLDEPTAFLDYPSKIETMRLLKYLAHSMKKIILLSTHDVELALQLSDKLWLMDNYGLCMGSPRLLADNGTIARFFQCAGTEFCPETLTFVLNGDS